MSEVEKTATRAVLALSEKEREVIIAHLKKAGIYSESEPISWNVKNFVFTSVGLPKPLSVNEKKKLRGRDIREKARKYEESVK